MCQVKSLRSSYRNSRQVQQRHDMTAPAVFTWDSPGWRLGSGPCPRIGCTSPRRAGWWWRVWSRPLSSGSRRCSSPTGWRASPRTSRCRASPRKSPPSGPRWNARCCCRRTWLDDGRGAAAQSDWRPPLVAHVWVEGAELKVFQLELPQHSLFKCRPCTVRAYVTCPLACCGQSPCVKRAELRTASWVAGKKEAPANEVPLFVYHCLPELPGVNQLPAKNFQNKM